MYNNMKKFSFSTLAAVILLAGLFAGGCKKDSDSAGVPKTEAEIVAKLAGTSSKAWLSVNGYDEDSITGLITGTRALKDCEKDDVYTFYTAKDSTITTAYKMTINAGATACDGEPTNTDFPTRYTVQVASGVATLTAGDMIGIIKNLTDSNLKMDVVGKDSKLYTLEMKKK